MVSYADFAKLDMRIGRIKKAERIEGSEKLYKLTVDVEGERTLVAGLAKYYKPEELEGKLVVVLVNLEPKKIFGVVSQGMILAAVDGDKVALLQPDGEVRPGAQVK